MAYADMTPEEASEHRPRVVLVDERNNPTEVMDLDGSPISEPNRPGVTNASERWDEWRTSGRTAFRKR